MAIFGGDKETQELLRELADRLSGSAKLLSDAARRLHLAELTYREYLVRLRKLDEQMRTLTDMLRSAPQIQPEGHSVEETAPSFCEPPKPQPKRRKLRYADYIEFSNYAELKKFEKMGGITDEECEAFDADATLQRLLGIENK
jgi:hypothetical protein